MADTLLTVIQRVLAATGQDPSVTSLSDSDDTRYLMDRVNDALLKLYTLKGTHVDSSSSITITATTRAYNITAGLDIYMIEPTSFRLDDQKIELIDLDRLERIDTEWDTRTAENVRYLYFDNGQICVYPILQTGTASKTLKFRHPQVWARLSATTDTFDYPDVWLDYVERYAQFRYEIFKGISNPVVSQMEVDEAWGRCVAKSLQGRQFQLQGYRKFGRR
jgi:hypothetical protein